MWNKHEISDPAISVLEQIEDQSVNITAGAVAGISTFLGNTGRWCTLSKECMNMC